MKALLLLAPLLVQVVKGDKMFIKGDGVQLLSAAKGGKKVMRLPAGTEVIWLGADATDKSMHQIDVGGKKVFVHMTALTPSKAIERPKDEPASAAPPPATEQSPPYAGWANDPAYATLRQLSEDTAAQKANVKAHAQAVKK